jgi:hypothetical protein
MPYLTEAGDNRLADYGEAPGRVNPDGRIGSTGITAFDKFREFFETVSSLPRGGVTRQAGHIY